MSNEKVVLDTSEQTLEIAGYNGFETDTMADLNHHGLLELDQFCDRINKWAAENKINPISIESAEFTGLADVNTLLVSERDGGNILTMADGLFVQFNNEVTGQNSTHLIDSGMQGRLIYKKFADDFPIYEADTMSDLEVLDEAVYCDTKAGVKALKTKLLDIFCNEAMQTIDANYPRGLDENLSRHDALWSFDAEVRQELV